MKLRRTLIVTSFGTVAQTLKTERCSACAKDCVGDASKSHVSAQHQYGLMSAGDGVEDITACMSNMV